MTTALLDRRALGDYGERLAARYLRERGMRILDRNWRCRQGEIDIVALDQRCVVICEVKTRSGTAFGEPVEAVTWRKAARLRRLAAAWISDSPVEADDLRIDVIGILLPPTGRARVQHVVGVGG
jgi:putative endonuclease